MSKILNVVSDEYGEIVGICLYSCEVGLKNIREGLSDLVSCYDGWEDLEVVEDSDELVFLCGESGEMWIDLDLIKDEVLYLSNIDYGVVWGDNREEGEKDYKKYCEGVEIDYVGRGWGMSSVNELFIKMDIERLKGMEDVLKDMRMIY